jgi:hypothetical protein
MAYPSFQEHEDSPQESGGRDGNLQFTRIFLTAWSDRWSFIAEHYRSGPFGLPASYSSLWPGVLADTFQMVPFVTRPEQATISDPNTTQLTHSTLAKITITYKPLDFEQVQQNPEQGPQLPDGTWGTYRQDSNVEFRGIPGRAVMWASDSKKLPPDVQQQVAQPITSHEVTWHQVRVVPWVTLGDMKGKVNEFACMLPGSPQVFQPETLLFEGLADETTLNLYEQQLTRKLTLRFTEMAQSALKTSTRTGAAPAGSTIYGWNHQFREDTGNYDRPINYSDSAPLFQKYNFNNLWTATT